MSPEGGARNQRGLFLGLDPDELYLAVLINCLGLMTYFFLSIFSLFKP